MTILIFAYVADTYATRKLAFHFRSRSHLVRIESPLECTLELGTNQLRALKDQELLQLPDAVLLRGITYYHNGIPIPRILETSMCLPFVRGGALCFNSPDSKLIGSNKLLTAQKLVEAGLPIPPTAFVWRTSDFEHVARSLGFPMVLKTLDGTWGVGVARCDSMESARSTFESLRITGQPFLLQRYIAESGGRDIRVLVIGDRVAGSMRCTPGPGEFRSNVAQGSNIEAITLTPEVERLAIAAARALGLDVAGVDIIETCDGPAILEVNTVPGFEALDNLCGTDAALEIVRLVEDKVAMRDEAVQNRARIF